MAYDLARDAAGTYAGATPTAAPASVLLLDRLETARQALRDVTDLDLTGVDAAALGDALETTVRLERTVAAAKAKVVVAADRAGLAGEVGAVDTIALLKDRARLSGRDAKRAVEMGRRLARMPQTAAALADGDLGVEQAEQLTRAATRGRLGSMRDIEASLLETAKTSRPEELREVVKRAELDADGDQLLKDERLAHSRRSYRGGFREDGMYEGNVLLDPVSGEAFDTMVRAFTTFDGKDVPEELRRSPEQRRADALIQAAKVALGAGEAPKQGSEKPHVSVIVTAETLAGEPHAPPAEMAWGGMLSRQALGRILCDATVTRIVADAASQVLDVGRATRVWSGSQRRAIVAMDGGCRFPGCDRPAAWTDIHHVKFYKRDGGRTDLCNGVLLCERHHHACHEGGWKLSMDGTTRVVTVVSPNGKTRLTSNPRGLIPRSRRKPRRTG